MTETEKASWIILTLIIALIGCSIGAYTYGRYQGYSSGYRTGYSKAPKPDKFKEEQYDALLSRASTAEEQYNGLVTDYNNLRNAVIKYIGATQYQARQPIRCSSHTYGINNNYSSTSCY